MRHRRPASCASNYQRRIVDSGNKLTWHRSQALNVRAWVGFLRRVLLLSGSSPLNGTGLSWIVPSARGSSAFRFFTIFRHCQWVSTKRATLISALAMHEQTLEPFPTRQSLKHGLANDVGQCERQFLGRASLNLRSVRVATDFRLKRSSLVPDDSKYSRRCKMSALVAGVV